MRNVSKRLSLEGASGTCVCCFLHLLLSASHLAGQTTRSAKDAEPREQHKLPLVSRDPRENLTTGSHQLQHAALAVLVTASQVCATTVQGQNSKSAIRK